MRVIAGKYRTKRLIAPEGSRVRPTTDRIKETMFNILYSKGIVDGINVLDLFAGTGALGIEALSRGAAGCVFVDIDRESCALVRQNIKTVGAESLSEVYHAEYKYAILKLKGRQFDLILVDPPFNSKKEGDIVTLIMQNQILASGGVIVIEHAKENELNGLPESLVQDTRNCGNTVLDFLQIKQDGG